MRLVTALCLCCLLAAAASATVYRVGPDEETKTVSAVIDRLEPGDVVEITGDITDSFVLRKSGTEENPIVIRGVGDGRPKIDFAGARNGIETRGDHYAFENLDFRNASFRGIFQVSHGITVRDCRFEGNRNGIMGADDTATGDILIEYCEFFHNGSGNFAHQIYLASFKRGATATVQFNYFHDSTGGANIKTRMPRNVIRYNWVEGAWNYECDLVDSDRGPGNLRPMHMLFLGNVVVTNDRGNPHHQTNVASDQPRSPGTDNTYLFVNNLFICNRSTDDIHMVRVGGDPADVGFYNNIFVGPNLEKFAVMCIEDVKADEGPAGSPGRVKKLHGSNNFAAENAAKIPADITDWIRAKDAGFVDFAGNDFTLGPGSPCAAAGTTAAGIAPRYLPPMRAKMAPGAEVARPVGGKIDLGPFGATVEGAGDDPEWLGK
ncbi:MAG: right-handed parallel beta-helix repeat-containing protein [Planctomycetota bacterium]|jgi:hypothetical protein